MLNFLKYFKKRKILIELTNCPGGGIGRRHAWSISVAKVRRPRATTRSVLLKNMMYEMKDMKINIAQVVELVDAMLGA